MRYHLTPVRMYIIKKKKKLQAINPGDDIGERGSLLHCW